MKLNYMQVVAWLLWAVSITGLVTAFFLDNNMIEWVLAALVSYGIVRLEWFLSALTEAKESNDAHEQGYDGL